LSASRWRSYGDVDAAADPRSLGDQLDDIAGVPFVAAEKQRSLGLLELGPGDRVLDVGCGTGPELERLGALVGPGGRVVGLDRSAALIGVARERGLERRGPIALVQGEASSLPFDDAGFDACRADRTLQHVEQPDRALAEMVRVTRGLGRVVVSESRWGLVAPSLDQVLTDRILQRSATGIEQAGWVGHRLPGLFERAGLSEVRSISSDHTVGERDDFFRFTHLRASAEDAAHAGAITAAQATRWLDSLSDLLRRGEAFAMVLVLHVVGLTPAA
jgi:SAM-dependent methyltransferase